MRRMSGDDGATAVLVAILAIVLFGMGAMVVDVGSLWSERRQLQNGADAGALAIAQTCAVGTCDSTLAPGYADSNSNDNASNVQEVCGSSSSALPVCTDPPIPTPPGVGWVMVRTQTGDDNGSGIVPPILAKALVPGYNGSTVHAYAVANWGAPAGIAGGLPLTFSECEWQAATASGASYAPAPPYPTAADGTTIYPTDSSGNSLERVIYFHDTTLAGFCNAGPSGADLSGGFGWLQPDTTCAATTTDGWFDDKTGAAIPSGCKPDLTPLVGHLIFVPIFDETNGLTGTNGEYHIASYAAFFLTGFRFPGLSGGSIVTNSPPCSGSDDCISGFFVNAQMPPGNSFVGDGPSMGANVVGLAQ